MTLEVVVIFRIPDTGYIISPVTGFSSKPETFCLGSLAMPHSQFSPVTFAKLPFSLALGLLSCLESRKQPSLMPKKARRENVLYHGHRK